MRGVYEDTCRMLPGLRVHTPKRNVLVLVYSAVLFLVATGVLAEVALP